METETSLERGRNVDYSVLEYDAIERLRQEQASQLKTAGDAAISSATYGDAFLQGDRLRTEAEAELHPQLDHELEQYVDAHISKTDQPEQHNQVFGLLRSVSAHNMSPTKWHNGDRAADGDYDYTTSGRHQAEKLYDQLKSEYPSVEGTLITDENFAGKPINRESPEFLAVNTPLVAARQELARLSLARRQMIRKGGKKAEALAAEYATARTAYDAALQNVTAFHVKSYRNQGVLDTKINELVLPKLIEEHHDFTQAEYDLLKTDNSLRARAARFLGKRGGMFGLSAVSGIAIGAGARVATNLVGKSLLLGAAGVSGGAVVGGVIAARLTKNILLAKVRNNVALNKDFDKRRAEDEKTLNAHWAANQNVKLEKSVEALHAKIGEVITSRVEKDRKSNARRVAISATIGGVAALAAFELVPGVEHAIGGWFHGSPDHNSVPGTAPSHTPSVTTAPHPSVAPTPAPTPSGPIHIEIPKGPITIGGGHPGATGGNDLVDGFHTNVTVEHGNGYIRELQDLAAQKHIHLSLDQATDAYHQVLRSQGAHFFTNDPNYVDHGGNRISHAGAAIWDHAHVVAFNNWLHIQEAEGKVAA